MGGWEVLPTSPRRSRRGLLLRGVLLACIALAFWAGSQWQKGRSDLLLDTMRTEQSEHELEELRQRVAVLQSAEQVSLRANEQSRLTIKLLEEQIYKQQQDLAFYKGVVAPERKQEALSIKAFELLPTETEGRYRYKVLLSRLGKGGDEPLQGQLHISVIGKQGGKPLTLSLADVSGGLAEAQEYPVAFAFKHFQAIPEGAQFAELQLPDGYTAENVRVKAEIKGQKAVERTFDWSKKE